MRGKGWDGARGQTYALFGGGSIVGLGDDQLLARYAASGDGAAFEALVGRYGPMVLATCRAVARDDHDAEDAFQATWLTLARRAGSVRSSGALGGWLHRVARRAAVRAEVRTRRQRRVEAIAAASAPAPSSPDPDLRPILHEEIGRLPERHRLPVILCDLEGLTYDQAAHRLRWTEPTLRCRLARARQGLRQRLARRGITGPAVAALLAIPAGTASAVPPALGRATVRSACGGVPATNVLTLTHTIARGMLMTRIRIAATTALTLTSLTTAGALVLAAGGPDDPRAAVPPAAPTAAPAPAVAQGAPPRNPRAAATITIRGQVVAPNGTPVVGASLHVPWDRPADEPGPAATSGPGGQYTITIPESTRDQAAAFLDKYPQLVATAPGFAPGWVEGVCRPDAPPAQTITLVEPGPAIEGRVVDLEGRPVAGVQVAAKTLWFRDGGDIAPWLASIPVGGTQGIWRELRNVPLDPPPSTTTDADGRYRLEGFGRDRIAGLLLSGPAVATETIYVMGRDQPAVRGTDKGMIEHRPIVVYPPHFEFAAAPSVPITGVIRDRETGQPIAGVQIRGNILRKSDHTMIDGILATTDAEGRYRLTGLPRASGYRLFTFSSPGSPYLNSMFEVAATATGLEPVVYEIALKRGVLVRGRVTDKATGAPVRASIDVFALATNPHAGEFPGAVDGYRSDIATDADGRFAVAALPGPGLLAVRADDALYRGGVGAETVPGRLARTDGGGDIATTTGQIEARFYHTVAGFDFPPGLAATLDVQVDPGRSLRIQSVDPEGQPIGETQVQGLGDIYPRPRRQQEATATIQALDPASPRRVTVAHDGRRLIGTVFLKGDDAGPLTVRLAPWAVLTGRIVDDEGRPRPGLVVYNRGGLPRHPSARDGVLPGREWGNDIVTDANGRFRVERLVPGLNYGGYAADGSQGIGDLFQDQTLTPGEVRDLGDLKPTRRRPVTSQ